MVDRVLDVRQGELCWVVGTVYMELGQKPNILDDIAKEVSELSTVWRISELAANIAVSTG